MSRFLSALRHLPNSFVCFVCFAVTCLPTSPLRAAEPVTKTVVCFGDSLTAGYGLESAATDAYPALLQEKLNASRSPSANGSSGTAPTVRWRVVNAGLSGETTAGGARRLDWILRQPVDIFLLALGANDGLRGIDPALDGAVTDLSLQLSPAVREQLQAGRFGVVLGSELARSLGVRVGEQVTVIAPGGQITPAGVLPRLKQMPVVGVFDSGHYEYDDNMALLHLADAQTLFRLEGPSGVRLKLRDLHRARQVADELMPMLPGLWVRD
jgi:hypothetical protein